jgi:hypothetical protein
VEALLEPECPFGPRFFLTQLRAFARDRCPDPAEGLPVVHLHLGDGEVLDICHLIGLAPRWVALAVRETEGKEGPSVMRTELVPYEVIHRVTIRAARPAETHIGFDQGRMPQVFADAEPGPPPSPEEALRAAATATGAARGKAATSGPGATTMTRGVPPRAARRGRGAPRSEENRR